MLMLMLSKKELFLIMCGGLGEAVLCWQLLKLTRT